MHFLPSPALALLAVGCALLTHASPLVTKDPAYTVPVSTLTSAITCPDGLTGAQIVLGVHGTSSTGSESWGSGPYRTILPHLSPRFDFCWVDLPSRALVDLQISAEYVAHAIHHLAPQSRSGKINIVSHSQGGPDTQWALEWFPSTRALVHVFVANSPDFRGTQQLALLEPLLQTGVVPLSASFYQQLSTSHMSTLSKNHAKGMGIARVKTVTLFSYTDEVVQPFPATGTLTGTLMKPPVSIQDVCPLYLADHFLMIIAHPAFELTYQAFTHDGNIDRTKFDPARCTSYADGSVFDFRSTVPYATAVLNDILAIALEYKAPGEPKFRQYVCDRGAAGREMCGEGYF